MIQRVFVSGEDGLLARALIERFRMDGATILNDGMRKTWTPPPDILQDVGAMGPREPEVDVLDLDNIANLIALHPTTIVHSAAMVGTDKCEIDGTLAWECNTETTFNLARAAKITEARLIYLSTGAVYDPKAMPPYKAGISPTRPATIYGQTKYFGEVVCQHIYGRSLLILRPQFVYGGVRDTTSIITRIAKAVIFDAPPVRALLNPLYKKDFMHVVDFGRIAYGLISRGEDGIFDVARGNPRPFGEGVEVLRKHLGDVVDEKISWFYSGDYLRDHFSEHVPAKLKSGQEGPFIDIEDGLPQVIKELQEVSRESVSNWR